MRQEHEHFSNIEIAQEGMIPLTRQLILDTTRSSTSTEVCSRESQCASFDLPYGELVELRVFIDRNVVEVFANGRHYVEH